MKTKSFSLLFLGIYFALIFELPSSYGQTSVSLSYSEDVDMVQNANKYFHLDVSNVPNGVNVAISSISATENSPKLFVSRFSKKPSESSNDYASTANRENTVIIPKKDIEEKSEIYIGIICESLKCLSSLRFELLKEVSLETDGLKKTETLNSLEGAEAALIRINVPKNNNAKRIVLHVDVFPSKEGELPELSVSIDKGREIPFHNNAINIPRTSWFQGRTLVINREDTNLFCTGCEYTLSLQFKRFSAISVEAHSLETVVNLREDALLDTVKKDQYNTYKMQVQEHQDLIIEIKPHEGAALMVYINCDFLPSKLESFHWIYHVDLAQDLVMSRCSKNTYFIAMYGENASLYSIRPIYQPANKFIDL